MLPNRMYNGLTDRSCRDGELNEEALALAELPAKRQRKIHLQIGNDRRVLFAAYKKACESENGALEVLHRDFHIVEQALFNLENVPIPRLPILEHGSHRGLPRVYDIAVCIVGGRDARVDEKALERFIEAYQSISPLTMAEISVLPDMLTAALLKLLSVECTRAIEEIKAQATAEEAVKQLAKSRLEKRQQVILERLNAEKDPALTERLYMLLFEMDMTYAISELGKKLKREDMDIEEVCARARRERARACQRVENAIHSLRNIGMMDRNRIFESLSLVHRELSADCTYCRMEQRSRGYYREWVTRLARRLGAAETVIARQAVQLAAGGEGKKGEAGYYLLQEGQAKLYAVLRPDKTYRKPAEGRTLTSFVTVEVLIALLLIWLAATEGIAPLVLAIIPSWSIASVITVRTFMAAAPVRYIPRLAQEHLEKDTVLVVIPMLITGEESLREAAAQLERHMLASRLDSCIYALLGDFPDSERQWCKGERELLKLGEKLIQELNGKYPSEQSRFYYLHRYRILNTADGTYMGRERKRGAICDLVSLITDGEEEPFCTLTEPLPRGIRRCITLDADTVLPPGAAAELIGCMAHPLNSAEISGGIVTKGYGMIAPRMVPLPRGAEKSRFAKLISSGGGIDGYFPTAPEFYQDVFGCGLFGGKGIFDISAFRNTVMEWIADNTVLSHDMLEGCFMHCGYAGDIQLFDSEPASFISWWKRQHRWMRGDWQLLPFLMDSIRDRAGVRRESPLSMLSRRKILDNIRRCMLPWVVMYTVVLVPYTGLGWHCLLALMALLDGFGYDLLMLPYRLTRAGNASRMGMLRDIAEPAKRAALDIITLPYAANRCSNARNRALYRMFVSHRKMLEWQTAAQTASKPSGINGYYGALYFNPAVGIVMAAGAILGKTPLFAVTVAVLWLGMPLLIWALDSTEKGEPLSDDDRELLMDTARSTWEFFQSFCTEESNYLPPDNFQQYPHRKPVLHTSPTNIGMSIMAALCAAELEIITKTQAAERLAKTTDTLERMEKWHGHLYNWYRTDTLEVLSPVYVSTVDSGNLCASLLTAGRAMEEYGEEKLAGRLFALAEGMDFAPLYNPHRRLFSIGYDGDRCCLSPSCYDLLASEARLTSLVASALGQVDRRHWFSLGRLTVPVCGRSLISWSGTMFEYLMPVIFTGAVSGTLLGESCSAAVRAQKKYAGGNIWGISESGYYAFDRNMYYQYRAFGIRRLSLTGQPQERVISPYSTLLALQTTQKDAMENLHRIIGMGGLGLYGMYEAIDFTQERMPPGNDHMAVKSYMAHHQGMGICAITNLLKGNVLSNYFWKVPALGAVRIFAEERMPPHALRIRPLYMQEGMRLKKQGRHPQMVRIIRELSDVPETQLLTNGNYTLFITDSGQGFSKYGDIMLTRWQPDCLRGKQGIQMLVSCGGEAFDAAEKCETRLYPFKAEFEADRGDISTKLEVCVSSRHSGEIRKLTVINRSQDEKKVAIGACFEPCLCPWAEDAAHPGFNRLTVDAFRRGGMLLFEKRPKEGKHGRYMYAKLISPADTVYLSDRAKAQGRGNTLTESMLYPVQQEDVSAPVFPFGYCRTELNIPAGESAEIWLIAGWAENMTKAAEDCEDIEEGLSECFDLAASQVMGMMKAAGVEPGKAQLFERMAARMLLCIPNKAEGNSGGLGVLWKHGISGDRPVMLVKISRVTQLRLLKTLGEFAVYMQVRHCPVDVAAVGEYPQEYSNELRERMQAVEGIHLIHGYSLGTGEYGAIRSCATVEVDTDVSLNRQFAPKPATEAEYRETSGELHPPLELQRPGVEFDNGWGGFGKDGEYIIDLKPGRLLPMPWCNVIANTNFGTMVSERGGGHTWHENSRENKLTVWQDSPIDDPQSEFILLTDMNSGETFSPFGGSIQKGRILVEHGFGYSKFTLGECGLNTELTVFVHSELPVKYSAVSVKNPGTETRKISIMYGVEWCLGDVPRREAIHTRTEGNCVFARNNREKYSGQEAYIAASQPCETCLNREAIFQRGWDRTELPNTRGMGGASALRTVLELKPREEKTVVFFLGEDTKEGMQAAISSDWQAELSAVRQLWRHRLNRIAVHTPDASMDRLMNNRLLYQVWAARLLGRCGYYQCGGAYGFRDQLQDVMALMHHAPETAKEHILLCASKQFKDGDVLHWWHSPNRGVRTRIADDRLFLPYVTAEYVEITADTSILGQMVTYLANRSIPQGHRDIYAEMADSRDRETLYMHCVRSVDSIHTGAHGLPLMQGGDWNDGMDRVGDNGGESVWLGWFMADVLKRMEKLAGIMHKKADSMRFAKRREKLMECLEKTWDGEWYPRAYYGDGAPLGAGNGCAIDCISQAWAAICGGEKANQAMDSLMRLLYEREEGILKLLTPPFEPDERSPGYIQAYIPGVRENGGQYTHAAAWAVKGMCVLGRNEEALMLFNALNPINHTLTDAQVMKYRTEPYALAGDVYSGKNAGRGGWTWYTGAAGWLYKVCLEDMLGIRRKGSVLEISPCVPFEEYTVEYRWGNSLYILHLSGKSRGKIMLSDDGLIHDITVGCSGD